LRCEAEKGDAHDVRAGTQALHAEGAVGTGDGTGDERGGGLAAHGDRGARDGRGALLIDNRALHRSGSGWRCAARAPWATRAGTLGGNRAGGQKKAERGGDGGPRESSLADCGIDRHGGLRGTRPPASALRLCFREVSDRTNSKMV